MDFPIDQEQYLILLHEKFPELFKHNPEVSTGKGWQHIIFELCNNIQSYINRSNDLREMLITHNPYNRKIPEYISQVTIDQIKQKFGGLRFYYSGGDDRIDGMVSIAESWALTTCELCGNLGKIRTGGWVLTLCDFHYNESEKRKNESK